ncbi:MarR family transcriptional regulator [Bacillus paramycoides]|uniref:MarR family transcriptional regulator n=1 Tax=Bacillus paramycoides TaxID=2026194 RepID=UPI003D202DA5
MIKELVSESENINKNWTLTQLHIVSVIHESKHQMNNTLLSMELNISKATISKAIRVLIDDKILLTNQNTDKIFAPEPVHEYGNLIYQIWN